MCDTFNEQSKLVSPRWNGCRSAAEIGLLSLFESLGDFLFALYTHVSVEKVIL